MTTGHRFRAAASAALLVLAAGCVAGQVPPDVSVTSGTDTTAGNIAVHDAKFPYQQPTGGGDIYTPGQLVTLDVTISNNGPTPDRLLALRSPISTGGLVLGDPTIPPGGALTTTTAAEPGTVPIRLQLTGLNTSLRAGLTYPVVFTFAHAGTVPLQVRVADPTEPLPECPLPPDGRPPHIFTAPSDAPIPPAAPPPRCSSLS